MSIQSTVTDPNIGDVPFFATVIYGHSRLSLLAEKFTILTAEGCQWRKCAPYMGALAAAGCAWSARGPLATVGSGRGWQAAGRNGQCESTGGFLE